MNRKSVNKLPTGVKGNAESTYRTGNINITPANIGSPTTTQFNTLSTTVNNKVSAFYVSSGSKTLAAGSRNSITINTGKAVDDVIGWAIMLAPNPNWVFSQISSCSESNGKRTINIAYYNSSTNSVTGFWDVLIITK